MKLRVESLTHERTCGPPEWRWLLAVKLGDNEDCDVVLPNTDRYIEIGRRFLIDHSACMRTCGQRGDWSGGACVASSTFNRSPALYEAHGIWNGPRMSQWAIKAMIVARVTTAEIAEEEGADPS